MAFIDERLAWIRAQMPRAFNTVVNPNMEVKRLPPEEEPGAPGAYGGAGSIDGTIPGRYWINLRTTDLHSKYSLADLTFHEAIPGHIWQGEYTHDMPLVRQMLSFNAYSEGWALYAEQLADELGAYENDRVGRLGYLQSIAFRACRLVVDTGLHAKGWTREQGVQFFVDVNGSNPLEVASEVDRYCSWPGQACGYKVGHSEINRQRERAQAALGARFDLKAFNDTWCAAATSRSTCWPGTSTSMFGPRNRRDVLAQLAALAASAALPRSAWAFAAADPLDGSIADYVAGFRGGKWTAAEVTARALERCRGDGKAWRAIDVLSATAPPRRETRIIASAPASCAESSTACRSSRNRSTT